MATPLSHLGILGEVQVQSRPEGRPHTASFVEKAGGFYGLVRHGNASSTTVNTPEPFATAEAATAHAQIFADAMNAQDALLDQQSKPEGENP